MSADASPENKTIVDLFRRGPIDIYVLDKNPRYYDWDKDQFEKLWTDFCALLVARSSDRKYLGVILSSTRDSDHWTDEMRDLDFHCRFVDIFDGQQRLTTMTLVFCAIRDYFKLALQEKETKACVTFMYTDILNLLSPTDGGDEKRTARIWQGQAQGAVNYLSTLLLQNATLPKDQNETASKDCAEHPTEFPRIGTADKDMSMSDRKMKAAYEFFQSELNKFEKLEDVCTLYTKLKYKVFFYEVRFAKERIPMDIILSSHHAKNIEPVDLFRYHLLHNSAPQGGGTATRPSKPDVAATAMRELQQDFDKLCSDTSRANVHDSFTMMAQFELEEPIRSVDGSEAVAIFERYLESTKKKGKGCLDVFEILRNVAVKWHNLVNGNQDMLLEGMDKELREKVLPTTDFALALARSRKAKDRKVDKLILQSVFYTLMIPSIHQKPTLQNDIPDSLKNQEKVFLWALFGDAKLKKERLNRFASIAKDIKRYEKNEDAHWAEILSGEEWSPVLEALQKYFGKSHRPLAKAILLRLNRSYLSRDSDSDTTLEMEDQIFIEQIDENKDENSIMLWDLGISSLKKPTRGDEPEKKKARLNQTALPLTQAMFAKQTSEERRRELMLDEVARCWSPPQQPHAEAPVFTMEVPV